MNNEINDQNVMSKKKAMSKKTIIIRKLKAVDHRKWRIQT